MAKVLNCKKYHEINVADHCHHHHQQQWQQCQEQRQRHTHITTNQLNNDNNNLRHSHLYSSSNQISSSSSSNCNCYNNKINNEFIKFCTLGQQDVGCRQHQHHKCSNQQQLTSVSSFSILKNRNTIANISNEFLPSLNPPSSSTSSPSSLQSSLSQTSPSLTMAATATCSFSPNSDRSSSSSLPPTSYLNLSTTYSTYSTCCVLTYNMFTAYAEAATLQLKRKTHFNKLLHVSGHPDMRSVCYLILTAFFYWGVMIRAAVATNLTSIQTSTAANQQVDEDLTTKAILYSNLIVNNSRDIASNASEFRNRTTDVDGANIYNKSFLKLSVSLLSESDETLTSNYQRRLLNRREAANVPDFEDDDSSYHDEELDEIEILIHNKSGKYLCVFNKSIECYFKRSVSKRLTFMLYAHP